MNMASCFETLPVNWYVKYIFLCIPSLCLEYKCKEQLLERLINSFVNMKCFPLNLNVLDLNRFCECVPCIGA